MVAVLITVVVLGFILAVVLEDLTSTYKVLSVREVDQNDLEFTIAHSSYLRATRTCTVVGSGACWYYKPSWQSVPTSTALWLCGKARGYYYETYKGQRQP